MRITITPPSGQQVFIAPIIEKVLKLSNVVDIGTAQVLTISGFTKVSASTFSLPAGVYFVDLTVPVLTSEEDAVWSIGVWRDGTTIPSGISSGFWPTVTSTGRNGNMHGNAIWRGAINSTSLSTQWRFEIHRTAANNAAQSFSRIADATGNIRMIKVS